MLRAEQIPGVSVRVVRSIDELAASMSLRSIVYVHEQACPYHEEFDGNDLVATHVVAWRGRHPVASLRIRWFAGFAKIERVCVEPCARAHGVGRDLVAEAMRHVRMKGYAHVVAHAQSHAEGFWSQLGFAPRAERPSLTISDIECVEFEWRGAPLVGAVSVDSPSHVVNRPEGAWNRPGVLEERCLPVEQRGAA